MHLHISTIPYHTIPYHTIPSTIHTIYHTIPSTIYHNIQRPLVHLHRPLPYHSKAAYVMDKCGVCVALFSFARAGAECTIPVWYSAYQLHVKWQSQRRGGAEKKEKNSQVSGGDVALTRPLSPPSARWHVQISHLMPVYLAVSTTAAYARTETSFACIHETEEPTGMVLVWYGMVG